ncbi:MAG TPA: IPT/TIG domain-containing protein [Vicinamibacterales bacterium]|nr:IPT/TIG domain-containing protein [Vicinamibacterales bacterium]
MRSGSLARVVMASLAVSVAITAGCGKPPTEPTPPPPAPAPFLARSISPSEGPTTLATTARIEGTGFQSGDTVIVDGSPVDATVLSATIISLAMPAHAAGKVEVTVSRVSPIAHSLSVPGGYQFIPPPVISELVPNIGSTSGGTEVTIRGTGVGHAVTVTVGGIVTPFETGIGLFRDDPILLTVPAHAAGTVAVILTDRWGQAARGEFTYASPATFDFNGDWQGLVEHTSSGFPGLLTLTIRDNTVASVSCSVCQDAICAIRVRVAQHAFLWQPPMDCS